jgi:1-acyl-sn-glycerol-3-phosphate acyltransferase
MCAVVFAEGTRSRTGDLLPFKKGPFVFAIASQVPLVPIYCAGTFDILPKGSIWVRPKPVTLMFGEPMSTKGLTYEDRQKLMAEARTVIERLRSEAGE